MSAMHDFKASERVIRELREWDAEIGHRSAVFEGVRNVLVVEALMGVVFWMLWVLGA